MSSIYGNIVLEGLKKLTQALQALEPAPNDTTVLFNDTVLCMNPLQDDVSGILGADILQLDNNGETLILNSNEIAYTPPGGSTGTLSWYDLVSTGLPTLQTVLNNGNSSTNSIGLTGASYSFNMSGDSLVWSPNPWSGTSIYAPGGVTINGADYNTNYTVSGTSIERPSSSQITYYLDGVLQILNSNVTYLFQNNGRFFKWDAGISFRVDNGVMDVEKDHSFKVSDNGNNFTFYPYTNYLDDNGNAGWSVLLTNCFASDISVLSPDIEFYSHGTAGITGTTFPLKKWATARFTLIPSGTFTLGYGWAVSMY